MSSDTKTKKRPRVGADPVTRVEYEAFQRAFTTSYHAQLFDGRLPYVLVTLTRRPRTRGYFSADRFSGRATPGTVHELALNPDHFGRTDAEILSTLVHEMAHVWQQESRASQARAVSQPGMGHQDARPGSASVHHREARRRDDRADVLALHRRGRAVCPRHRNPPPSGFTLHWHSTHESRTARQRRLVQAASKTKFVCPDCEQNAWAESEAQLLCGQCYEESRELVVMESVPVSACPGGPYPDNRREPRRRQAPKHRPRRLHRRDAHRPPRADVL